MNEQARDEAKNGPVRAIAGSVKQRTAAASGVNAVIHREAARLASAVLAVRNLR
jgi:hypothetical protein